MESTESSLADLEVGHPFSIENDNNTLHASDSEGASGEPISMRRGIELARGVSNGPGDDDRVPERRQCPVCDGVVTVATPNEQHQAHQQQYQQNVAIKRTRLYNEYGASLGPRAAGAE